MSIPKLRAAIVVFIVGFALGLSVFAASRLFVRTVLSADATAAAEELASRLASGGVVEPSGALSAVQRFTQFNAEGEIVQSGELRGGSPSAARLSREDMRGLTAAADEGAVVDYAPLVPSLLGLGEPSIEAVAAPIVSEGRTVGAVIVEVDQTAPLQSLTRAFSIVGMVSLSLGVLAIITVSFAVSRGSGLDRGGRKFDARVLPRDPLTGLLTRQGFVPALADAVKRATEADQQVGLMIIDLEGFRAVNAVWGHKSGDEVLKATAERLAPFAAGPCALSRVDGDHFALVVEQDATSHALRQLAGKIREALKAPYPVAGSSIALGASIGAAVFPVNADNAEMLFRAADTALSKAKAQGRNSLAFFDTEMKTRMQRRTTLERDLRQALERDEFVIFYQPQLELATGRLRGCEALVRWERPGEGILAPQEFLPVAEETGLIRPLGEWVLRKACTDAMNWSDSRIVAVNFSAAQFRFQELDRSIAKILAETGLPAERLEIEIPEKLFLDHTPEVMETLIRIKALGVRVAMDDFGSGYSGLASLAHFPFDKIKIDRSFVSQLTEDADVAAIVASVVGLGRSLSVDITAEGVETNEQVTLLRAAGCNIVQGFLFGVPQPDVPEAGERPTAPEADDAVAKIANG